MRKCLFPIHCATLLVSGLVTLVVFKAQKMDSGNPESVTHCSGTFFGPVACVANLKLFSGPCRPPTCVCPVHSQGTIRFQSPACECPQPSPPHLLLEIPLHSLPSSAPSNWNYFLQCILSALSSEGMRVRQLLEVWHHFTFISDFTDSFNRSLHLLKSQHFKNELDQTYYLYAKVISWVPNISALLGWNGMGVEKLASERTCLRWVWKGSIMKGGHLLSMLGSRGCSVDGFVHSR